MADNATTRMLPPSGLDQVLGSTVAGFTSTILGHPLDTIKTHLQASATHKRASFHLRKLRWKVFRGMGPPLINSILMNTVMFSVFEECNHVVNSRFLAAAISGLATALISTPTDYLKIHSQLASPSSRSDSWWFLRRCFEVSNKKNPWRRLYQGHLANLGREGVFTMVYLGLYHHVLMSLSDAQPPNLVTVATISSLTGALAWIVSYPFDTIKTLRQSGCSYQQIYQRWNRGSSPFLFAGCATSTGRAILVTSSRMVAYESYMTARASSNT